MDDVVMTVFLRGLAVLAGLFLFGLTLALWVASLPPWRGGRR